jgi:hypothetical protein
MIVIYRLMLIRKGSSRRRTMQSRIIADCHSENIIPQADQAEALIHMRLAGVVSRQPRDRAGQARRF